jgi:hypothetical protein
LVGKRVSIHYKTGAIAGYISQDNVQVGGLVVKNQVYAMHQKDTFILCNVMCILFQIILILLCCPIRILLKLRWNRVLLSCLKKSMASLVLGLKKCHPGVPNLFGEKCCLQNFSVFPI